LLLTASSLQAQTVRIGIFTLFHPREVVVRSGTTSQRFVLESLTAPVRIAGPDLIVSIPGKIERRFQGTLELSSAGAVMEIDLETAVASVVAAESPPGASIEALKAQAIAARSFYFGSAPRHEHYSFCDTTHCQFLRAPPDPRSAYARATALTRGQVLSYEGAVVPVFYSADCGGRTRSLGDAGGYPYFAVECAGCRGKPMTGHGIGLCQRGAARMASRGAGFRQILEFYLPATRLIGAGTTQAAAPAPPTSGRAPR
jgi:peptidoglycan hydrolase-like amidase